MGWPTCLHVAGSRIVLQCLATTTKFLIVYWSRYLPLGNWMTRKLGRIIEKEIISPEICCRNLQFDIKLWDITHTCCSMVFAWSLNKAIREKSVTQHDLQKMSIKFHVTSLPKWQKVLLIFRNIGPSITEENSFHVLLSKHFFSKHCSFSKISSKFLSFNYFLLKFCNQK